MIHTSYSSFIARMSESAAPGQTAAGVGKDYDWEYIRRKVKYVKSWLGINTPFYAKLLANTTISGSFDIGETMATNGRAIYYHPDFVLEQSVSALAFVISHELMHCIGLHHLTRGSRDPELWNVACDYAINPILHNERGLDWPVDGNGEKMGLYKAEYAGMSAEAIYDDLMKQPRDETGQSYDRVLDSDDIPDTIAELTERPGPGEDGQEEGQGKPGGGKEGQGEPGRDTEGKEKEADSLPSVGQKVRLDDGSTATIKKVYPNGDIEV